MTTPFDSLVSVYGETFPLRDIQRVGRLHVQLTGETIFRYKIYLCTGQIAEVEFKVSDSSTDAGIKALLDVEQGRQRIIDARWPMMHKIVIPDPAIGRQGDDC